MKEYTYREIKEEVMRRMDLKSYSLRTVKNDVDAVLQQWREEHTETREAAAEVALERIRRVRREAYDMWEKSKVDYEKKKGKKVDLPTDKKTEDGKPALKTIKLEAYREEVFALGDPRYLDIIMKCNQEEAKLLGLYAPQEHNVTGQMSFAQMLMQTSTTYGK